MREMLAGRDRRSIGAANQISNVISTKASLFDQVASLLSDHDPCIRMRAADALEKASRASPALLQPHVTTLLHLLEEQTQQEVVWHVLQMLPRVQLTVRELRSAFALAEQNLHHESRIASTSALSAMAALAIGFPDLEAESHRAASALLQSKSPSVRARAKHVLAALAKRT